jgi:hypothetical protein
MTIDQDMLEQIAQQGLGHIVALAHCPNCGYIAKSSEEETLLARVESPCPNCAITGHGAGLGPNNYLEVANWIGEFAASDLRRDHSSAVILFCSFVEAMLETLKDDYLKLHPMSRISKPNKPISFKNVFGVTFEDAFSDAPTRLKDFPSAWKDLREKRNKFLHGRSSYVIHRSDAHMAVAVTADAVNSYRWLHNKHCLSYSSAA